MRKVEKQKDSVGKIMGNILNAILPDDDTVAYYRGQRGLDYLLVPKAMRVYPDSNDNPILDYETSVTNDLVVNYPEEFGEVSPLKRLSRIEHRDLASRLVNISASVLNSLFFSCSALTEKDSDGGDPYLFRFDYFYQDGHHLPNCHYDHCHFLNCYSVCQYHRRLDWHDEL